jgi:hypothetical protein
VLSTIDETWTDTAPLFDADFRLGGPSVSVEKAVMLLDISIIRRFYIRTCSGIDGCRAEAPQEQ